MTLLFIVGMTFWLNQRTETHLAEIVAARDIRTAAVEARAAMQAAEASQRGYLLTGNEIYLAPYSTSKLAADRRLSELKRSIATRQELQTPVEKLTALLDEKFSEMDNTIDLKRSRKDEDALAIIRTNRGKRSTDEANVFFAGIILAADDRLTRGGQEQSANARLLSGVSIMGAVLIVLVTSAAIFAVSNYARTLTAAWEEVRTLNSDLEKRVAERTAHLAQVNEEVQRFAYVVSHDLRAPLVNIMGFTNEIEQCMRSLEAAASAPVGEPTEIADPQFLQALKEDAAEAIGFIRSSTKKMDSLINAILKLSREGSRKLQIEDLDLAELLQSTLGALKHQLQSSGGTVRVNISRFNLKSDRLSLEQILTNLIDNAIKYRSPLRPLLIDVTARRADEGVVSILVTDNGRGIATEGIDRAFEMFRRSGKLDQPGEGIGLAHIRTLVRKLGGEVSLSSELDVGTTVTVRIPDSYSGRDA